MFSRAVLSTVSLAVLTLVFVACGDGQPAPAQVSMSSSTPTAISVSSSIIPPTPKPKHAPTPATVPTQAPTLTSAPAQTPTPATVPTQTSIPASASAFTPTPTPLPTSTPVSTQTATLASAPTYLTEEIPPCTPIAGSSVDPCEPDVKIQTNPLGDLGSGGIFEYDQPQTVRAFLDGGSISFIPHIVLRGTYIPDTARCTAGNPFHVPSYQEPGYFQHSILLQCFADVRVNGYILGEGPDRLTVQVSFLHYWDGYYAQEAASLGMTEQELLNQFLEVFVVILKEGYGRTGEGIYGREVVLFIGPGSNHATEVWQVYETWDVQRQADDTVIVVHPHRDSWRAARPDDYQTHRSQLEMELPAFTQAVTTAHQARVTEYGGRIAPADIQSRAEGVDLPMLVTDANQLRQFYTDTGAYDHPDGPPSQPPPPCGLAVPDQANNPGLMRDCITLLELKDTLAGTAALDWTVTSTISIWEGISLNASSTRVTVLELDAEDLDGAIPPGLGGLSALVTLDLSDNDLTGEIPEELGRLSNLEVLRLSGNSLTGCIPSGLRDVADNDLAGLGLDYCGSSAQ